jgi:hypothetical protein
LPFFLTLLASINDSNLVLIFFRSVTLQNVVPYLSCRHTVYHHVSVFPCALLLMKYFRPVLILVEITLIAKNLLIHVYHVALNLMLTVASRLSASFMRPFSRILAPFPSHERTCTIDMPGLLQPQTYQILRMYLSISIELEC